MLLLLFLKYKNIHVQYVSNKKDVNGGFLIIQNWQQKPEIWEVLILPEAAQSDSVLMVLWDVIELILNTGSRIALR